MQESTSAAGKARKMTPGAGSGTRRPQSMQEDTAKLKNKALKTLDDASRMAAHLTHAQWATDPEFLPPLMLHTNALRELIDGMPQAFLVNEADLKKCASEAELATTRLAASETKEPIIAVEALMKRMRGIMKAIA
eukprot:NODE_21682_length_741_cov_4.179153.p2 GENE.NODE_21682_length_741_cov_4.179153~~NODE_21682_length_741_cov_4.179153.p2  ORF type:complete len:135 (+),score=51.34 NODE_21682_length_741_cov_4.179153:255-659(+)